MPPKRGRNRPDSSSQREEHVTRMQKRIADAMCRLDEPSQEFICDDAIRGIWSRDDLRDILQPDISEAADLAIIEKEFIKILSILVHIGGERLGDFRELFFNYASNTGSSRRTDDKLPFTEERLNFLGRSKRIFNEKQYAFIPVVLQEHGRGIVQRVERQYRLPFTEENVSLGTGGYGNVQKVGVAPGYLKDKRGRAWTQVEFFACKRFRSDQSEQAFQREAENLEFLKESLSENSRARIMMHWATIVHGREFIILFPLAKFGNLEVFFNRGFDTREGTIDGVEAYDFAKCFPMYTQGGCCNTLIHEMLMLAESLRWLHTRLHVNEAPDLHLYCAHMDLKPDNILIDQSNDSPVGKWMITDFGISVFRNIENGEDVLEERFCSIREVRGKLTNTIKTVNQRNPGPYQAPEVQNVAKKVVGRRSDIWSFGCVFAEVLTFGLGDRELLEEFRIQRSGEDRNDYFYTSTPLSGSADRPSSAQKEFRVKDSVIAWLDSLPQRYPNHAFWLSDCIEIIQSTLVIIPRDRVEAVSVYDKLEQAWRLTSRPLRFSVPSSFEMQYNETQVTSMDRPSRKTGGTTENSEQIQSQRVGRLRITPPPANGIPRQHVEAQRGRRHPQPIMTGALPPDRRRQMTSQLHSSATTPERNSFDTPRTPNRPPTTDSSHSSFSQGVPTPISSPYKVVSDPSVSSFKATLPLPKGEIVDMALSPRGERVAFLSHDFVHIFPVARDAHQSNMLPAPRGTKWRTVELSGYYLALYGIGQSGQGKSIYLCDLNQEEKKVPISEHIQKDQISRVIVSCLGMFVFVADDYLWIMKLGSKSLKRLRMPEEYTISQATFSTDGRWVYVWAFGPSPNWPDHSYFWNVENYPTISSPIQGNYEPKKDSVKPPISLLPYQTMPRCAVSTTGYQFFVAQNTQESHTCRRTRLNDAVISCVLQDKSLVAVFKRHDWLKTVFVFKEYDITTDQDGMAFIEGKSIELGATDTVIEPSSRIAAPMNGQSIVVCTVGGKIERIRRRP